MQLAQVVLDDGHIHGAILDGADFVDIADPSTRLITTLDYLDRAILENRTIGEVIGAREKTHALRWPAAPLLAGETSNGARLTIPMSAREGWGCGVTYKKSAEFRDEDAGGNTKGIYDYVYAAERPETFYKGGAAHCVGPWEPIGIRRDSNFTAPEPELALIIDVNGGIVGFTCANDVSAWDIERENPLYLPQSKIFKGCLSIGPVIVTPDEAGTGMDLDLRCRILRGGAAIFDGSVNTSRIGRTFAQLIEFLIRDNPIQNGTIVCTGTGVIAERQHALKQGDQVEITIERIGTLVNPVVKWG